MTQQEILEDMHRVAAVWNLAIEEAAKLAESSYFEDEGGTSPMTPAKIGQEIRKLKGP